MERRQIRSGQIAFSNSRSSLNFIGNKYTLENEYALIFRL